VEDDGDAKSTEDDLVRLHDYREACRQGNAVEQSTISRHLGNRSLDLTCKNMGNNDLKPLFVALKVSLK
jgi:hypothetical protein